MQKVSYVVLLMIYWDQKRKFWYNHLRTSTDFDANKFNPYFYLTKFTCEVLMHFNGFTAIGVIMTMLFITNILMKRLFYASFSPLFDYI